MENAHGSEPDIKNFSISSSNIPTERIRIKYIQGDKRRYPFKENAGENNQMRFRTAIIWNIISQFGQSGIVLLSTVILARKLTPDDFGIVGIVAVFMAFSQMVVDSEMGGSLLRKEHVTKTDYSTLFHYNLIVSLALYIILFLAAPLVARLYSLPDLTAVIRVLSLAVIIHAFRVVQFIMLLRAFKFQLIALIHIISGLLSLTLAIILADHGFGYWSLIWQQICSAAICVIMMGIHNRFIPALRFSKESFRYQFGFGMNLLGAKSLSAIASNISTNVIAKISSLQFTGYYSQSSRLTSFFGNFLDAMMSHSIYPLMAKSSDRKEIRHSYHRILILLMGASSVIMAILMIFAPACISLVLGKEWIPAADVFRILALTILPAGVQSLCRNVMKTLGTTRLVLHIDSAIAVTLFLALAATAAVGNMAVVWSVVTVQYIGLLIWICITEHSLKETQADEIIRD